MGNRSSRTDSLKRRSHGHGNVKNGRRPNNRYPASVPQETSADVETLGLSFGVCKRIFLQLPLLDLSRSMLVCKEWRSLIDTCAFWRAYTDFNFDCKLREVDTSSPLFQWKYFASNCFQEISAFQHSSTRDGQSYAFQPFPDMWKCGIVVPHSLTPPDGNLWVYHNLLHALCAAKRLYVLTSVHGLDQTIHVCLFQWVRDRLPTAKEVFDIFNANRIIVDSAPDTRHLTKVEMKSSYGLLTARYGRPRFDMQFFSDVVRWTGARTVICDSGTSTSSPAPCFLLTPLADGWCGGLLYGL